jgi:hypothetical protein
VLLWITLPNDLLVDLSCKLLGGMELQLVLSYHLHPHLFNQTFPQLSLICCQLFNLVFVHVLSFEIYDVMSVKCESRDMKLKMHIREI